MGPPSGAAAQHGHGRPTMIAAALPALPPPAAAAARARDRRRPRAPTPDGSARGEARAHREAGGGAAGPAPRARRRRGGARQRRSPPSRGAARRAALLRERREPSAPPRRPAPPPPLRPPAALPPARPRRPSPAPRPLARPPPLHSGRPPAASPPAPLRPNFSVPAATCCPRALRDQGRAGGRAAVGGRRRAGRSPPAGRNLWVSLRRTFFCLRSLSTTFAAPAPYPSAQSAAAALTPAAPGGRGREGRRELRARPRQRGRGYEPVAGPCAAQPRTAGNTRHCGVTPSDPPHPAPQNGVGYQHTRSKIYEIRSPAPELRRQRRRPLSSISPSRHQVHFPSPSARGPAAASAPGPAEPPGGTCGHRPAPGRPRCSARRKDPLARCAFGAGRLAQRQ